MLHFAEWFIWLLFTPQGLAYYFGVMTALACILFPLVMK